MVTLRAGSKYGLIAHRVAPYVKFKAPKDN